MAESWNVARARKAYLAFATGDMTSLAEVMAPDVTWVVGGNNALTGTYHGQAAIFDMLGKLLLGTEGTFHLELRMLAEPEPGLVLARVRTTAQVRGLDYDDEVVQQIEFRDGLAVSCRTFQENGYLFDQLVGPAVINLQEKDQTFSR